MSPSRKRRKSKAEKKAQASKEVNAKPHRNRLVFGVFLLLALLTFGARPSLFAYRVWNVRSLIAARQLPKALEALQALHSNSQPSGETHFLLGRVLRKLGRLHESRRHLQSARELGHAPEMVDLEEALALAQSGRISQVESQLRGWLANSPQETAEICEALVSGYMRNYRFGDAAQWIDAWEADFPKDPQPHVARGMLWQHLLLWNEAVEAFSAAAELAPQRLDVRLNLGSAFQQLHRFDEAAEQYQIGLQYHPNQPALLGALASCHQSQGRVEDAKQLFEQVITIAPERFDGRYGMAQLALGDGDWETALQYLKPLAKEFPRSTAARYALASALRASGDKDAADKHLAFVEEKNKAMSQIQQLTRTVQSNPDEVQPRVEVGKLLMEFGSESEGASWLATALELQADHQEANQVLGEYYQKQGKTELAQRYLQAAGR